MTNTNASRADKKAELDLATIDGIESLAASCLVAIAFSFLILREDVTTDQQKWLWLIFVVAIGLIITVPAPRTISRLLLYCLPSCAVFFATLIFQGALGTIWGALYIRILSYPPVPPNDLLQFVKAGFWYLFLFVATLPAIAIAVLAKLVLVGWVRGVMKLDPRKLGKVEKLLRSAMRILVLLGFGFLVTR